MSERIFPAWPAAPVQPYTAREVAQDSLDIHMANCTLCLEDRKCDDVHGLVDALAALSKCAICGTVSPPGYADETLCADDVQRLICHDCLATVPEPREWFS
jgi:hypothetical protein